MGKTSTKPAWRYPLIVVLAIITIICIGLAISASSQSRARGMAAYRAPGSLREAKSLLIPAVGVQRSIPGTFSSIGAEEFVDRHFEIRRGATIQDVAAGRPAVLVRPESMWLLDHQPTAQELGQLNSELSAFCRELRGGRK